MLRARIVLQLVLLFLPASLAASTDFLVPPGPQDNPLGIITGPDGNLWFTNSNSRSIGRITPSGVITTFPVPGGVFPDQIAKGADGNLWFTESGFGGVGRMTPAGVVTKYEYDRPTCSYRAESALLNPQSLPSARLPESRVRRH